MTFKFADLVKETFQTTGTGTLDLDGAPSGFRAAIDELANLDESTYISVDDPENPTQYEYGLGHLIAGSPNQWSRDTVYRSTNADNKVSWSAGVKTLILAPSREVLPSLPGDDVFTGIKSFASQLRLTGTLSPAQIAANQNDYDPTNLATANTLRLTSDAARSITGLAGGAAGRVLAVVNVGSFAITLENEDAASAAANRFAVGGDLAIAAGAGVVLEYDGTSSRWRAWALPLPSSVKLTAINVFTTANDGAGAWSKPAGLDHVVVHVVGGGGGGGGGGSGTRGIGGGGGGTAIKRIAAASLGATEDVTVGAAGAGGASTVAGTAGGTSSLGAHASATGGAGGVANLSAAGAAGTAGGIGSSGDLNIKGSGTTAGDQNVGGAGGDSHLGGGAPNVATGNGAAGGAYGGGGGGSGIGATAGGNGAEGVVVVYEYGSA